MSHPCRVRGFKLLEKLVHIQLKPSHPTWVWGWKNKSVRKGVLFIYIKIERVITMLQKNERVPFVCDDEIPDGLYPYCREVFDTILEAKIPYGRTRTVLKLVSQALQNVTPGEIEIKREKTDYPTYTH